MTAFQILLILRARFWLVLIVLAATVGVGFGASLLLPKKYTASAAVLVDVRSPDPVSSIIDRGTTPPPILLAAQVDIVKSARVARKVVTMLKLNEDPAVRDEWTKATDAKGSLEEWLVELMQKRLSIKPSLSGAVVAIEYEAKDPGFAAAAANGFAQAWIETNIELKVDQARQYSRWFGEQGQLLRENLEKARSRLSEFQREKGIVARDERLDAETIKLQDLSARLTVVQTQTAEAAGKQRSGSAGDTLPEVAQNPLIVPLKADIVRQEARLDELAGNLGRNHPQYQSAAAELAALKRRVETETQRIVSGFSAMRASSRGSEVELKAAIEAQQRKVLLLKTARDQLAALQRDVDAAQASYDAVERRYAQISLESQANQSNVFVFSAAVPPTAPSSPNLLRIMLGAVLLGALFGAGAAIGLETLDPRIRSADQVVEMLQFPVLGVIPHFEKPRRVAAPSRLAALEFK
jgi:chain length determinant protein EpsF